MAHRFRKLIARLRAGTPVRFGPRRWLGRPAAPADRFTRFGDGRRALVAEGPDVDPVDVLRAEMGLHEPHNGPHSHTHSHGDGTTHSHSHFHADSAVHNHGHGASSEYAGMTEAERRIVDPHNEIVGEDLDALVASLIAGYPEERLDALTAATGADGTVTAAAWHSYLCAEGIRTDDGRELALGACRYPDLPVSIRLLVEDEGGHWGAVTCGRIDSMERRENQPQDGINLIYATGVFGTDPNGQLAELMVEEQTQRFVSIDPRDVTGEMISVRVTRESYDVIITDDDDDDTGEIEDCWFRMTDLVVGAATIVPMPAIQNAVITLASVPLPDSPIATASAPQSVVVAAGTPQVPSKAWFEDPGFHVGDERLVLQNDGRSYACPLTIDPDGRVYGHVCHWNADHTGFPGRSVKPPRSLTGYSYYLTGPGVDCEEGWLDGVGQITMACGHADTSLGYRAARDHYDGGAGAVQVADVRCGEDQFGVWIAGSLRPNLTDDQLREFKALSLSGDWRDAPIGGRRSNLEMVAVLAVPVPGFPIRRSLAASAEVVEFAAVRAGMHDDQMVSLVAAGRVARLTPEQRLARVESALERHDMLLRGYQRAEIAALRATLD